MPDLTLRQVEVIRAVMMTGTIQGAAGFLNVSPPGVSRLLKHTEETLGLRLFERRAGLFAPAPEAAPVFEQLQQIHEKMAGLWMDCVESHSCQDLSEGFCAPIGF